MIVRRTRNGYPSMCEFLIAEHGFSDLYRLVQDNPMKSKAGHLLSVISDALFLSKNLKRIRKAEVVIAFGHLSTVVLCLAKLGLLPACQRIYWMAFFIHDPFWLRPSRWLLALLDSHRVRYVLFSEFEKGLYHRALNLPETRMLYLPFGDWAKNNPVPSEVDNTIRGGGSEGYYFSGGYSNRDYVSLIRAFKNLPCKLLIVCSFLNREIKESGMPDNIRVLRDVPSATFDAYIAGAKACVLPILHNTGAAGQSVLLRCMRSRKLIIATGTDSVKEYIEDGVSGILVENNAGALAEAVRWVEGHEALREKYGRAAFTRFRQQFSYTAISGKLAMLVTELK